jgi:hypothetical protein
MSDMCLVDSVTILVMAKRKFENSVVVETVLITSADRVLVGKPESRRPLGRPRRR